MSGFGSPLGGIGALMQGFMQGRQMRDQEQAFHLDQAGKALDIYRTIAQANPQMVQDPHFMQGVMGHLGSLGIPQEQVGQYLQTLPLDQQKMQSDMQIARRKSGVDLQLPEKMQYLPPNATPDQEANHYRHIAAWYANRGADDQAAKYEGMARDAAVEYEKRSRDAALFSQQFNSLAEKIRHDKQQEGQWKASDEARLQAIQANLQGRIITGEYSVERATIAADAAIQNTNTRATVSERNTDVQQAGQNQRLTYRLKNDRVNKEYDVAHRSWEKNQGLASIALRMGKTMPPGWTVDAKGNLQGPPQPISPDDFESKINDTLDLIRQNKVTTKQAIQLIGQMPGLTPAQKSEAAKAFTNPKFMGGSDAAPPFPPYPR